MLFYESSLYVPGPVSWVLGMASFQELRRNLLGSTEEYLMKSQKNLEN